MPGEHPVTIAICIGARYRHYRRPLDRVEASSDVAVRHSRPMTDLGPLGPLDELLAHQIVDTFATVSQSDRSKTKAE